MNLIDGTSFKLMNIKYILFLHNIFHHKRIIIGKYYEDRIIHLNTEESVKAISVKYTAEQFITKRANVSTKIKGCISSTLMKKAEKSF